MHNALKLCPSCKFINSFSFVYFITQQRLLSFKYYLNCNVFLWSERGRMVWRRYKSLNQENIKKYFLWDISIFIDEIAFKVQRILTIPNFRKMQMIIVFNGNLGHFCTVVTRYWLATATENFRIVSKRVLQSSILKYKWYSSFRDLLLAFQYHTGQTQKNNQRSLI